jgi:tetratricopeptide (TPR) repeat protein
MLEVSLGRIRIKKKKPKIPNRLLNEPGVTVVSYDIVFEPLEDENKSLDPELIREKQEIHDNLRENPKECSSRLAALIERYPDYPVLYNYLTVAYTLMGDKKKARDLILETYRRFPDYLFAKIAYVELCLQEDKLDEIPRILDNKYDLKFHYPDRTKFHITEYTAFAGTVGFYLCRIGKPEVAKHYYETLKGLAPDDPQTKRLKRALKAGMILAAIGELSKLSK